MAGEAYSAQKDTVQTQDITDPYQEDRVFLCIDLKSFYASVECVARGLDPFTTNLIVADPDRTEKTICLAITPAMKALGVKNRCRVFEIPKSVDFIMAKPRMKKYMEVSAQIYQVYLEYIAPEDIHVYSIDECFIDITNYLSLYDKTPRQMAVMLMDAVFSRTGICATAGIGTNLFLAKVALDVTAKHAQDHIGYLDHQRFREQIWQHRPITDIWNIGPGIARRLAKYGVEDLKGICMMPPETLYREFGVNAEYLIDHARGYEPCTIQQIHDYVPEGNSLASGQVLSCDYTFEEARAVLREMTDSLILELVEKDLVASSVSLAVGYAKGPQEPDAFGQTGGQDPSSAHAQGHGRRFIGQTGASRQLGTATNSQKLIMSRIMDIYDATTRKDAPIRRINLGFGHILPEEYGDLDLFAQSPQAQQEKSLQKAVIAIKDKYGKNSLLKGTSYLEKSTARERNNQVGGHHA
ncbi:MAG: DNA repair protein [Eggerthellales bacterium]|nr:DNA repair protein [Eggerthellales bacterium]